jgi:DNA-directed RNA polymerase subunit delta
VGKMYAIGENFEYMIEDEEYDISVVGDIMMFGDEYLIGEDLEGKRYVFIYKEDEERVQLVEDLDESSDILDNWEEEYFAGGMDIGDWDDDSYYEREDKITTGSGSTETYFEDDDFSDTEAEEDVDSFISGLMEE